MIEFTIAALVVPAFIAGILTFLAPCTLPLVPAYLAFISGVSPDDLKDPSRAKSARLKIFLNGFFFVLGFSVIFLIFGTIVAFISSVALVPYRLWLVRLGGIFVIIFGFFMLGVFKIPFLSREARIQPPVIFKKGNPIGSFLIGSAFAFGWTPCVGPILGSILFLASASETAFQGAFLLAVFSLGLAIPFLAVAFLAGSAAAYIDRFTKYLNVVSIVGGLFLIVLGILLFTNNMSLLISYGYRIFRFIEYDRLLDYL